nr:MAG TPA: Protein of unknown function (DUF2552) [Caudoviricetes sp.]
MAESDGAWLLIGLLRWSVFGADDMPEDGWLLI